jgi:hypothetical protein
VPTSWGRPSSPYLAEEYLQREFGAAGMVRYPIDRFRRLEASVQIRGIDRFDLTDYIGDLGGQWKDLNPIFVFLGAAGCGLRAEDPKRLDDLGRGAGRRPARGPPPGQAQFCR